MSGLCDRSVQGPGVYAVQALAAQRDAVVVHGGGMSRGDAYRVANGVGNHASDVFMSVESAGWRQCQDVAPPRIPNPAEVLKRSRNLCLYLYLQTGCLLFLYLQLYMYLYRICTCICIDICIYIYTYIYMYIYTIDMTYTYMCVC